MTVEFSRKSLTFLQLLDRITRKNFNKTQTRK